MKFKHGDILIDASDPEDNWELIFLYYEDYKDNNHYYMFCRYVSSRNEECDCVVGWYEKIQGKEMFYSLPANSLDFWYARGRHILTEVIR